MYWVKFRRFRSKIGFRIALYFSSFLSIIFLFVFAGVVFVLSEVLQSKDEAILKNKIEALEQLLKTNPEVLKGTQLTKIWQQTEEKEFFFRIIDSSDKRDVYHLPLDLDDFDIAVVLADLSKMSGGFQKFDLEANGGLDRLFGFSKQVNSRYTVQVGKNIEDREELIQSLSIVFIYILIPALVLSLVGGLWIAKRALKPVRSLAQTMRAVEAGDFSARVGLPPVEDELSELILVFNKMIVRMQGLIHGMRFSLDNVAHDLRTPLTKLRAIAEIGLTTTSSQAKIRSALESCLESGVELTKLVNSLMDIAEADAGATRLNKEKFSLVEVFAEVVDLYEIIAIEKQCDIEIVGDQKAEVVADRTRIKQAVANLVDNALKYSPSGRSIQIRSVTRDDSFTIEVQDEGMGVSDADLPLIWDRLYRSDKSRTLPGWGLGLSIVSSIAKAHNGVASAHRNHGAGMIFRLTIPTMLSRK